MELRMTLAEKLDALAKASLIVPASLDSDDQAVVNSLSDAEVNALVSIKGKLTSTFLTKHFQSANANTASPATRVIGIVF
jgi:hypothetical protein